MMHKYKDSNNTLSAHYTLRLQTKYTYPQLNGDPQAGPYFHATA